MFGFSLGWECWGIDSDRLWAIFGPAARHRERWRLKRWRVMFGFGLGWECGGLTQIALGRSSGLRPAIVDDGV